MQPSNVFVLIVASVLFLQGVLSYEVEDLSLLKDQFQTLISELEANKGAEYDKSIATLLGKLDKLQHSSTPSTNVTLDYYFPTSPPVSPPPLRIMIVVSSFEGMYLNSGIGTFYSALADFLVQHGHAVTILYTDTATSDTPAFKRWRAQVEKRGMHAARLGVFPVRLRISTHAQRSYQVYEYLKTHQQDFDIVHFPDWEGPGYYSILAKHDGIAFDSKLFIVGIHGPWRWVKAANEHTLTSTLSSVDDLETDWMERRSVELADMVWTPSADMVEWLSSQGWAIPSSVLKMPYLPGREISQVNMNKQDDFSENINELVFFGRLETRKGVELFADALDRLAITRPEFAGTKITFMGRVANIGNQTATAFLDARFVKGAWPFKVVYISHKDRKGALEYLREPTRIAVIPSLVDNTPYTVYECLFSNVPFIATNIPSISSLIQPSDRDRTLFAVDPISLSRKIEDVLDNGVHTARSSFQMSDIASSWVSFYSTASTLLSSQQQKAEQETTQKGGQREEEGEQRKKEGEEREGSGKGPLVSVCITHFNRPEFLQMAIESVLAQSYANYEVVLVDDGSTTPESISYLASLELSFAQNGWQLVRTENKYLGAARNKAASLARGEYLLFLDDDNLAMPKQLETYVEAAKKSNADVLTAAHDVFEGKGGAKDGKVLGRWVPLGPSPSLGLFKNCFGDANFFIKKESFTELKGFTEDRGVGQEDHEFLAKAVLSGRKLVVVPEPLLMYRMHNQSEQMIYTTDSLKNALRAHRPYRNLIEASGIAASEPGKPRESNNDFMKLLAYNRVNSRQASATCNLTVFEISPPQISADTSTILTFTVAAMDCEVTTIRIGYDFVCSDLAFFGSGFTCAVPQIPVPGDYAIFVQFQGDSDFEETGAILTVFNVPMTRGTTKAVITLSLLMEPGQSVRGDLLDKLATISPNSHLNIVSEKIQAASLKRSTNDEVHQVAVSVVSLSPTASQVVSLITRTLDSNPSVILPYRIYSGVHLNAHCDDTGECSCGPNFQGPGCSTLATCLNDCSMHGECVPGSHSMVCVCNEGWTGSDCSSGVCQNNCNGHGTCEIELNAGNGTCLCDPGWTGVLCETATKAGDESQVEVNLQEDEPANPHAPSPASTSLALTIGVAGGASFLLVIALVAVHTFLRHRTRRGDY